jgi:hypothetical protein
MGLVQVRRADIAGTEAPRIIPGAVVRADWGCTLLRRLNPRFRRPEKAVALDSPTGANCSAELPNGNPAARYRRPGLSGEPSGRGSIRAVAHHRLKDPELAFMGKPAYPLISGGTRIAALWKCPNWARSSPRTFLK